MGGVGADLVPPTCPHLVWHHHIILQRIRGMGDAVVSVRPSPTQQSNLSNCVFAFHASVAWHSLPAAIQTVTYPITLRRELKIFVCRGSSVDF